MEKDQGVPNSSPQIKFTELPPGLIHFTAVPKIAVKRKSDEGKTRSFGPLHKLQRRLVSKEEVDDISGLMTNLNFRKENDVGTSFPSSSFGAQGDRIHPFSVTPKPHFTGRRAVARRKMRMNPQQIIRQSPPVTQFASFSFGASGDQTTFLQQPLFGGSGGFRPWLGCRRIPFKSETGTGDADCRLQNVSFMTEYRDQSAEEIRVQDYTSGLKGLFSTAHFGPKFRAVEGADIIARFGIQQSYTTRHQNISAMVEYGKESVEELRLEHYMPAIGWEDRERYHLTLREMRDLPISVQSEVFVFIGSSKRKGKVRYIGRLPGKPWSSVHVGVELDGPFGDGHGHYGGVKLFRTPELHAEIVPLDAALPAYLVAEEDGASGLLEDRQNTPEEPGDTAGMSDNDSGSQGANKCAVCWTNTVEMFFLPCGHVCCCARCSKPMKDCPICRKRITAKHKVYFS